MGPEQGPVSRGTSQVACDFTSIRTAFSPCICVVVDITLVQTSCKVLGLLRGWSKQRVCSGL